MKERIKQSKKRRIQKVLAGDARAEKRIQVLMERRVRRRQRLAALQPQPVETQQTYAAAKTRMGGWETFTEWEQRENV